jgi:hypothetical protein
VKINLKSFNLLLHTHILYKDLTEHFLIKNHAYTGVLLTSHFLSYLSNKNKIFWFLTLKRLVSWSCFLDDHSKIDYKAIYCIDTTLCDKSLSVTCSRSVVFSGYSSFLYQKSCTSVCQTNLTRYKMSNVAKATNVKKNPFVLNLKSDFQAASFNGSIRKCPACSIPTSPTPMFSSFLHQKSWPLRYQWNIVESCAKHHQNKQTNPLKSYWTQTWIV